MKFDKKVALVTGGSAGIGRATALRLAAEGAKVGVLGHRPEDVADTTRAIRDAGGEAEGLVADVARFEDVRTAVNKVVDAWGRLDILIANAGINGVWAPIEELEPEEWDRTLRVNLNGIFYTFKATIPHLKKRCGAAVITASVQGTTVFSIPGSSVYAATKAALVAFGKKAALEMSQDGVRVNIVSPGAVDTRIDESTFQRNVEHIRFPVEYPEGTHPLNRGKNIHPEDVADLMLFLVSDEARTMTGSVVLIDNGLSLTMG